MHITIKKNTNCHFPLYPEPRTKSILRCLLDITPSVFLKEILLSKGTVNTSVLSTREIFIEALRYQAVHILLLHNHPSGDATPSMQDIEITNRIKEASRLMNIPLLDHIIIGDNIFTSLKEKGYL